MHNQIRNNDKKTQSLDLSGEAVAKYCLEHQAVGRADAAIAREHECNVREHECNAREHECNARGHKPNLYEQDALETEWLELMNWLGLV